MNECENEKSDNLSEVAKALEKMKEGMERVMKVEVLDQETARMIERAVIVRISTMHINLWVRS